MNPIISIHLINNFESYWVELQEGDSLIFNQLKWIGLFQLIVLLLDLLLHLIVFLERLLDFDLENHDLFFWFDDLRNIIILNIGS